MENKINLLTIRELIFWETWYDNISSPCEVIIENLSLLEKTNKKDFNLLSKELWGIFLETLNSRSESKPQNLRSLLNIFQYTSDAFSTIYKAELRTLLTSNDKYFWKLNDVELNILFLGVYIERISGTKHDDLSDFLTNNPIFDKHSWYVQVALNYFLLNKSIDEWFDFLAIHKNYFKEEGDFEILGDSVFMLCTNNVDDCELIQEKLKDIRPIWIDNDQRFKKEFDKINEMIKEIIEERN